MAARLDLIDQVRTLLAQAGFAVSERVEIRPVSFDIVARRDERLLIIKVLGNVDALNERVAQELRTLARFLHGTPILVGERSGAGPLEAGVAYSHRGIPTLTLETLREQYLENTPPMAYATPGGLNVSLDGPALRRIREERALSLGQLAQIAGVSRRAIQMYEDGMRATINAALRLEEFLDEALIRPVDPNALFERAATEEPEGDEDAEPEGTAGVGQLQLDVFRMLRDLGYRVVPTNQSPFNALTHHDPRTILTGVDRAGDPATQRRAQLISKVAAISEKDGMIVVRREVRVQNLHGTPVVHRSELERARDPQDLSDLLAERRKRRDPEAK